VPLPTPLLDLPRLLEPGEVFRTQSEIYGFNPPPSSVAPRLPDSCMGSQVPSIDFGGGVPEGFPPVRTPLLIGAGLDYPTLHQFPQTSSADLLVTPLFKPSPPGSWGSTFFGVKPPILHFLPLLCDPSSFLQRVSLCATPCNQLSHRPPPPKGRAPYQGGSPFGDQPFVAPSTSARTSPSSSPSFPRLYSFFASRVILTLSFFFFPMVRCFALSAYPISVCPPQVLVCSSSKPPLVNKNPFLLGSTFPYLSLMFFFC